MATSVLREHACHISTNYEKEHISISLMNSGMFRQEKCYISFYIWRESN